MEDEYWLVYEKGTYELFNTLEKQCVKTNWEKLLSDE